MKPSRAWAPCGRCRGAGLVPVDDVREDEDPVATCPRCGGEGLEPRRGHGAAPAFRAGYVGTLRGHAVFQCAPDGGAWCARPAHGRDGGGDGVVYPSLGALLHALRAGGAPA